MQSLEVDLLLRVCPDEEETIDQIVNLLVDEKKIDRFPHDLELYKIMTTRLSEVSEGDKS